DRAADLAGRANARRAVRASSRSDEGAGHLAGRFAFTRTGGRKARGVRWARGEVAVAAGHDDAQIAVELGEGLAREPFRTRWQIRLAYLARQDIDGGTIGRDQQGQQAAGRDPAEALSDTAACPHGPPLPPSGCRGE